MLQHSTQRTTVILIRASPRRRQFDRRPPHLLALCPNGQTSQHHPALQHRLSPQQPKSCFKGRPPVALSPALWGSNTMGLDSYKHAWGWPSCLESGSSPWERQLRVILRENGWCQCLLPPKGCPPSQSSLTVPLLLDPHLQDQHTCRWKVWISDFPLKVNFQEDLSLGHQLGGLVSEDMEEQRWRWRCWEPISSSSCMHTHLFSVLGWYVELQHKLVLKKLAVKFKPDNC